MYRISLQSQGRFVGFYALWGEINKLPQLPEVHAQERPEDPLKEQGHPGHRHEDGEGAAPEAGWLMGISPRRGS